MKNLCIALWALGLWSLSACQNPSASMRSESESKPAANSELFLHYVSSAAEVRIEGGKLFYSQTRQDVPPQSPVAHGNPVTTIVSDGKALSPDCLNRLRQALADSGFLDLDKEIFGAGAEDRYYPYELKVEMDGRSKKALFRSNPSAPEAPPAFQAAEKAAMEAAQCQ